MRAEGGRWLSTLRYYSVGLISVVVALASGGWMARHSPAIDLSANTRHTLVPASIQAVQAFAGPITVTAYMTPKHRARQQLIELVERYQRHSEKLKLQFIDPQSIPPTRKVEQIVDGDVTVSYDSRSAPVTRLREEEMTRALLRLLQDEQHFIAFVTGHGERSPLRPANFDLGHWHEILKARGYQVLELNFAEHAVVPDNTSLLVIASPQLDYLPGEIKLIHDYVADGGALLWLTEPAQPTSLDSLAQRIGFESLPATIVDPVTRTLGIDNPALTVVTRYPAHPALAGLKATCLFPFATPLQARPLPGWQSAQLLETSREAWGETGSLSDAVEFDAAVDRAGPLGIAIALTHARPVGEQRVVIIGDGDFLSNTYIGNGGNQALGTHLIDWLVANESLIKIETRLAPDVRLDLARWQQAVIAVGFLFVLPLAFGLNGWWIGRRRRRA